MPGREEIFVLFIREFLLHCPGSYYAFVACIETMWFLLAHFCLFLRNFIQFQVQKAQFHGPRSSGCWDIDPWKNKSMAVSDQSLFGHPIMLTPNFDKLQSLVSGHNFTRWKPDMSQTLTSALLGFLTVSFSSALISVPYPPNSAWFWICGYIHGTHTCTVFLSSGWEKFT